MPSGYNQHNLIFAHSVVLNYCCQRQEYQAFPLWALYEEILQNYSRTSSKKFQTYIAQIWNNVIQHMLPTNQQDPQIQILSQHGKTVDCLYFLGAGWPSRKKDSWRYPDIPPTIWFPAQTTIDQRLNEIISHIPNLELSQYIFAASKNRDFYSQLLPSIDTR